MKNHLMWVFGLLINTLVSLSEDEKSVQTPIVLPFYKEKCHFEKLLQTLVKEVKPKGGSEYCRLGNTNVTYSHYYGSLMTHIGGDFAEHFLVYKCPDSNDEKVVSVKYTKRKPGYSAYLHSAESLDFIPSLKKKFKTLEKNHITGSTDVRSLYAWIANLIRTSYGVSTCYPECKAIQPSKTNVEVYYSSHGPATIYRVVVACHETIKKKVLKAFDVARVKGPVEGYGMQWVYLGPSDIRIKTKPKVVAKGPKRHFQYRKDYCHEIEPRNMILFIISVLIYHNYSIKL